MSFYAAVGSAAYVILCCSRFSCFVPFYFAVDSAVYVILCCSKFSCLCHFFAAVDSVVYVLFLCSSFSHSHDIYVCVCMYMYVSVYYRNNLPVDVVINDNQLKILYSPLTFHLLTENGTVYLINED